MADGLNSLNFYNQLGQQNQAAFQNVLGGIQQQGFRAQQQAAQQQQQRMQQSTVQEASQLWQQGDIQGAIGTLAQIDPSVMNSTMAKQFLGSQEAQQAGAKETAELEAQTAFGANPRQLKELDLKALKERQKEAGVKPSPGQAQLDKKFGEAYNEFVARGGSADVQKNLNALDAVAKTLEENPSATGGIKDLLPKSVRNVLSPETASLEDAVKEVAQRNLRLILGPQFTEKEGAAVLDRAYNPRLPAEENLKRVRALSQQIQRGAVEAGKAAQYFEENAGTLQGYRGTVFTPSAAGQKPEIREINGAQYQKVPGGWQKVK